MLFDNIAAITFDVGGTLIKPKPSVGHIYASIAARHGVKVSPTKLNQQFARAWADLAHFHHSRAQWAALVDRTFAGFVESPPSQTFFDEIYDRFRDPDAWHVFEDVLPTLDALAARGINLGVISNWDDRLRPLLEKLGLAKYFEVIVISCEVGFTKPSPVIFEQAMKSLGQPPDRILHIGDSVDHDVAGAHGAGFKVLRVKRNFVGNDTTISALTDLESRLG